MASPLTAATFSKLLGSLDPDPGRAGEKYEELRRVLVRYFEWRGAPYPEEHADETFDRVSRKLGANLVIANIGGDCYEVGRLVCLEAMKSRGRSVSLESSRVEAAPPSRADDTADAESRLACLDACLDELTGESRELILEYYRHDRQARIESRRALAERFGLQREALANRAQRVRNGLERCVKRCVSGRSQI